jgi:hypothetical protein
LNLRPPGPQPGALPDCATPRDPVDSTDKSKPCPIRPLCEHTFAYARASRNRRPHRRDPRLRPLPTILPTLELAWRRKARGQRGNYCRTCRAAYKQPQLAGRARRDRQVRRRLCKLSSSANRSSSRIRPRGGSSTVEPRPSKAMMRVRFPSAASTRSRLAAGTRAASPPALAATTRLSPAAPARPAPAAPPSAPPPPRPRAPAEATAQTSCPEPRRASPSTR